MLNSTKKGLKGFANPCIVFLFHTILTFLQLDLNCIWVIFDRGSSSVAISFSLLLQSGTEAVAVGYLKKKNTEMENKIFAKNFPQKYLENQLGVLFSN